MKTHAQTIVECDPELAWTALIDFAGRARHSPRMKEAVIVEGGGLSVGKHLRLQMDNSKMTLNVEEVTPPSRLHLTMSGFLYCGGHLYSVARHDRGSMVRIEADYGGPIGAIFGLLTKGRVQRDLTEELATIKKQAEEPGKPRWPTA